MARDSARGRADGCATAPRARAKGRELCRRACRLGKGAGAPTRGGRGRSRPERTRIAADRPSRGRFRCGRCDLGAGTLHSGDPAPARLPVGDLRRARPARDPRRPAAANKGAGIGRCDHLPSFDRFAGGAGRRDGAPPKGARVSQYYTGALLRALRAGGRRAARARPQAIGRDRLGLRLCRCRLGVQRRGAARARPPGCDSCHPGRRRFPPARRHPGGTLSQTVRSGDDLALRRARRPEQGAARAGRGVRSVSCARRRRASDRRGEIRSQRSLFSGAAGAGVRAAARSVRDVYRVHRRADPRIVLPRCRRLRLSERARGILRPTRRGDVLRRTDRGESNGGGPRDARGSRTHPRAGGRSLCRRGRRRRTLQKCRRADAGPRSAARATPCVPPGTRQGTHRGVRHRAAGRRDVRGRVGEVQLRMIRRNNPAIDVAALEDRVRSEAARLRRVSDTAGRWSTGAAIAQAMARYQTVAPQLEELLDRLNRPREQLPPRFAKLGRLGSWPGRILVRAFNYLFRQQRELNAAQAQWTRELHALVTTALTRLLAIERALEEPHGEAESAVEAVYASIETRLSEGERSADQLGVYLSWIRDGVPVSPIQPLLDLRCGDGRWLRFLREAGVPARGLDWNPYAVRRSLADGIDVREGDPVRVLRASEEKSFGAISALQLLEHLTPGEMLHLFAQTYRCLVPGGLLLVEALDPADPQVASYAFSLNPTRRRLLPSELLVALSETVGFVRIETQQVQKARYALTARRP